MNNKIFPTLIFALATVSIFAQNVTVKTVSEIETGLKSAAANPVLNFEGNKMLFSADGNNVLYHYDFEAGTTTRISEASGSGYHPVFSNDGKRVFFHEISYQSNRRYESVESYSLIDSVREQMLTPRRDVKQLQPYNNGFIVLADGLFLKATFGKSASLLPPYASVSGNKIMVYDNNKAWEIRPFAATEVNYIWVSVSPDGNKILFTATGKGTYICDMKGKILAALGLLNAPVWYNDNFVAGMYDKDDGHVVTSSEIVLVSADGKSKYPISPKDEIAMYPSASSFAGKIAWQTNGGGIKVAEIEIK